MPILSGPKLDRMVSEIRDWYFDNRKRLIAAMVEEYPYGSIKLSPDEQLKKFMTMSPDDWRILTAQLSDKYRGEPDQAKLVQQDINHIITQMSRLAANRGMQL